MGKKWLRETLLCGEYQLWDTFSRKIAHEVTVTCCYSQEKQWWWIPLDFPSPFEGNLNKQATAGCQFQAENTVYWVPTVLRKRDPSVGSSVFVIVVNRFCLYKHIRVCVCVRKCLFTWKAKWQSGGRVGVSQRQPFQFLLAYSPSDSNSLVEAEHRSLELRLCLPRAWERHQCAGHYLLDPKCVSRKLCQKQSSYDLTHHCPVGFCVAVGGLASCLHHSANSRL